MLCKYTKSFWQRDELRPFVCSTQQESSAEDEDLQTIMINSLRNPLPYRSFVADQILFDNKTLTRLTTHEGNEI